MLAFCNQVPYVFLFERIAELVFILSSLVLLQPFIPENPVSISGKGSFWENMLPYFKNSETGKYLTLHPQVILYTNLTIWPKDMNKDRSFVNFVT